MGIWAFIRSLDSERGAALAEWGLLVSLVAIVAMVALTLAGEEVSGMYSDIASAIDL
jgi:Flp pilus assembly pilin Flp